MWVPYRLLCYYTVFEENRKRLKDERMKELLDDLICSTFSIVTDISIILEKCIQNKEFWDEKLSLLLIDAYLRDQLPCHLFLK